MRKSKNVKKIRRIILLTIIILILLFILGIVLLKNITEAEKNIYTSPTPVNTEGWLGYKNMLSDVYKGSKDTYQISTKIQQVFEIYIPVIKDKILELDNTDEILEYYEANTEYINNKLCIKNKDEFEKIINHLLGLECDLSVLDYCIYLEGSYKKKEGYEIITFSIYYTDNKKITLDALISGEYNNMNVELKIH